MDNSKSQLGTAPLGSLMLKLALPSIVAQVINILYNVIDRIYIGHIDSAASLALTGVGICFPIITLVSAFSLFAGAGGAPLAAIELGKSEHDKNAKSRAESILGNAVILLVAFAVLLTVIFQIFMRPVLMAFGASEATIPYAKDYLRIYMAGTIFVQLSIGLNPFINAQGFAGTAMLSIVIGAVANIILDPVFIFVFDMGVKGAAVATVISQAISTVWIVIFLCSKKSSLRISPAILKFKPAVAAKISALGLSPFIMSATESAISVVFNTGLQKFGGDIYVGAMTIMQSLMQVCYIPIQGFTDGVQPIVSYNYGAGNLKRVRTTIKRMIYISFAASVAAAVIILAFPKTFVSIFTSDAQLISLAVSLMPVYFGAVWIFGVQMAAQRTFVALGRAKTSIFVALLRKVILLIPLALVLPHFMGVNGIFWSEPIASTTSAVTSFVLFLVCYSSLKDKK